MGQSNIIKGCRVLMMALLTLDPTHTIVDHRVVLGFDKSGVHPVSPREGNIHHCKKKDKNIKKNREKTKTKTNTHPGRGTSTTVSH